MFVLQAGSAAAYGEPVPRRPGSLTPTDERALSQIVEFAEREGRSPTVRELAASMGWRSSATAQAHVDALVAAGKLVRQPVGWRLAGAATGGRMTLLRIGGSGALEAVWDGAPEPPFRSHELQFAMEVVDDDMATEGVPNGSWVYATGAEWPAAEGDLAIVGTLSEGRHCLLVRRLMTGPGGLVPRDPAGAGRDRAVAAAGDFRILGVVVSCFREFDRTGDVRTKRRRRRIERTT